MSLVCGGGGGRRSAPDARIKFAALYTRVSRFIPCGSLSIRLTRKSSPPSRLRRRARVFHRKKITSDDRRIDTLADFCRSTNPQSDSQLYLGRTCTLSRCGCPLERRKIQFFMRDSGTARDITRTLAGVESDSPGVARSIGNLFSALLDDVTF